MRDSSKARQLLEYASYTSTSPLCDIENGVPVQETASRKLVFPNIKLFEQALGKLHKRNPQGWLPKNVRNVGLNLHR